MQSLLPVAEKSAARLVERRETIAIAESSTGGLVAAALLAVPGASAYFAGGAVVYTKSSRLALLGTGRVLSAVSVASLFVLLTLTVLGWSLAS